MPKPNAIINKKSLLRGDRLVHWWSWRYDYL